ncbi:MAG: hypothetical protein PHG47_11430 [Sulfuricella sp.]|nr:hypothetical protein [Sulfuricella sp.]
MSISTLSAKWHQLATRMPVIYLESSLLMFHGYASTGVLATQTWRGI